MAPRGRPPGSAAAALLPAVLLCLCCVTPGPARAASDQERASFLRAEQALKRGRMAEFRRLAEQLTAYPLYPYLLYDELRHRLGQAASREVQDFLAAYPDHPDTPALRRAWLRLQAKHGRHREFLHHYRIAEADDALRCLRLRVLLADGRTEQALREARDFWLSGRSRPRGCDPVFTELYRRDMLDDPWLWQRFQLALEAHQAGLARFLAAKMSPARRTWARRWLQAYRTPNVATRNPGLEDGTTARAMLELALIRMARRQPQLAARRYKTLREDYSFDTAQEHSIRRALALGMERARRPEALHWLEQAEDEAGSDLADARLRFALRRGRWDLLARWTANPSSTENEPRRRYWQARALEQLGQQAAARAVYRALAEERGYYAFLAADRVGLDYAMRHRPESPNPSVLRSLAAQPGFLRTREWLLLERPRKARREWHYALTPLSPEELSGAALLAHSWNRPQQVILTLARAQRYDDLELRFPLLHLEPLQRHAAALNLEPVWVLAVVRAESAFLPDARSRAGALGLMQVLPATGRSLARRHRIPLRRNSDLLRPELSIRLGTRYLDEQRTRFGGNQALASAAYNAGPGRVLAWLKRKSCPETDTWIEWIPFRETRSYVKDVLYFTAIYDWRLHGHRRATMSSRMTSQAPAEGARCVLELKVRRDRAIDDHEH